MERSKKRSRGDSIRSISSPLVQPLYDRQEITDISSIRYEKINPSAPLSHLNSVINFEIPPNPNCLTVLQDSLLHATWTLSEVMPNGTVQKIPQASIEILYDEDGEATGEIKLKDGTQVTCVEPGAPLIAFKNVLLSVNGTSLPAASNDLNHYSSYFSFLLDSSPEARRTTLREYSLFYPKESNKFEMTDPRPSSGNKSLAFLYSRVKDSKTVETISPLAGTPLSSFNRGLPPNTSISVTLDKNRPPLYVLSSDKNDTRFFGICFESLQLLVKRVELPPPSLSAYLSKMSRSPIMFPYKHFKMTSHEVPSNSLSFDLPIGEGSDELPSMIRFGFVRRKKFLGTYSESSFFFEPNDVRTIRVKESDSTISSEYAFYYPSENTSSELDTLTFLTTTTPLSYNHLMKVGNQFDKTDFSGGYAILSLDLSRAKIHDEKHEDDVTSTPRKDKITLSFEFSRKTVSNEVLILQEIFHNSIHIARDGTVSLD